MTNYEKIKNMTVEGMAKFLIWVYFDMGLNSSKYINMEKWLKSEVKE